MRKYIVFGIMLAVTAVVIAGMLITSRTAERLEGEWYATFPVSDKVKNSPQVETIRLTFTPDLRLIYGVSVKTYNDITSPGGSFSETGNSFSDATKEGRYSVFLNKVTASFNFKLGGGIHLGPFSQTGSKKDDRGYVKFELHPKFVKGTLVTPAHGLSPSITFSRTRADATNPAYTNPIYIEFPGSRTDRKMRKQGEAS